MAKAGATSVHIGVNSVDAKHYAGWSGKLLAAELDAKDMATLAKSQGFKPKTLLTRDATRANVLAAISAAAKATPPGGFFLLTYSGHGGQVEDVSGDEMGPKDDTWCLFDAQFVDDELFQELSKFPKGSRILVVSDSSASGSIARHFVPDPDPPPPGQRSKLLPPLVAERIYYQNQKFYDPLQRNRPRNPARAEFVPSILVMAACQFNQTAMDGKDNGIFTARLRKVWNNGSFQGNYAKFLAVVGSEMPSTQSPILRTAGPAAEFLAQEPFRP